MLRPLQGLKKITGQPDILYHFFSTTNIFFSRWDMKLVDQGCTFNKYYRSACDHTDAVQFLVKNDHFMYQNIQIETSHPQLMHFKFLLSVQLL